MPAGARRFLREEPLRMKVLRQTVQRAPKDEDGDISKDISSPSSAEEHKENVHQPVQPVFSVQPPIGPKHDPPWQYAPISWRNHPTVLKYSDEAFIFIPAASYPAHSDAAFALIAWLRQPGRTSRPLRGPLHSGVVRIDSVGWVVTLGNLPGALDRMLLLLEWKAGKALMFGGVRRIISMDTHLPLEWLL